VKIAFLFERFPSPTETFLAREVEALRRFGFEIEIWALQAGQGARQVPLPPRAFKLLGKANYWRRVGANWGREVKLSGATHLHATWANHIAQIAQNASQSTGLPWSFAAHARDLWVEGGDLGAKLSSAQFAATCTRASEIELKKHGSNVIYAPHGLEISKYKWRLWQTRPHFRVVGVGRLVEKKGWPDALEAIALVNSMGYKSRLVLIGDGPLLREFLKKGYRLVSEDKRSGSRPNLDLRLYGALPHAQAIKVMRRCHCLILPSRRTAEGDRDGLANVLLEAAALGLPIVTTNAGSAGDFVDASTGLIVEPENPAALAAAIRRVFMNPEATQERCRAARARVEADFDIEKNIAVLARAFKANFKG
jgi:glycosyltransferase involved in cell wall biosynthesis